MKRTLAIILSLVMLFSVLPLTAYAADIDTADAGSILSGTTGNVQFAVDDRGSNLGYKLTVTGDNTAYSQTDTYTVHNTTEQGDAPWMSYNRKITQINISNTKYIRGAFYSCAKTFTGRDPRQSDTGLKLTMDANVKQIDSYAFANSHITETNLDMCTGLETIGKYAFKNCDFTEISFRNTIVGEGAFKDCTNLKKVYINSNGAAIGVDAFAGCTSIEYVYYSGTPDEFFACLFDGNDCLKNADTIEFGKPNRREITEPIYLSVTEPVAGDSPDYSLTMTPNIYCEINTNTYSNTGLDISNITTGQPANNNAYKSDNIYRFSAYIEGKTGKDSNNYDCIYVFTTNTPVYINGKKATVNPVSQPNSDRATAYYDFTPSVQNTCTVTFNKNGGTGTMNPVTVNGGSSYKLPACTFTPPTNKRFKNWKIGSSYYNPGDTVTVNSDITVYAQWEDDKYTITFDKNGGTGSMNSVTVYKGSSYTLPACTFTAPENKKFKYWKIGNTFYSPGESFTVTSNITAYAYWINTSGVAERVDITVSAPKSGEMPSYDVTVYGSGNVITGNEVPVSGSPGVYTQYKGVLWRDMTTRKNQRSNAAFVDGHEYRVSVDLKSMSGTTFNFEDDSKPMTQIYINGSAAEIQPAAMGNTVCTAMYTFTKGSTVSGTETSYLNDTDTVTIQLLQSDTVKYSTTATGNTASYSITGVANGTYTLRVSKKNHVDRDYDITVSGNKTQDVKICPKGDTNNDGSVKANDATMAYRHAQGKSLITDPYQFACANVAGNDEYVKANDATQIYRQAQGKHSLF